MTDTTEPATDERIARLRAETSGRRVYMSLRNTTIAALIARIDAERGRADRAEAEATQYRDARDALERQLVTITDRLRDDTASLTARAEKAERELKAIDACVEAGGNTHVSLRKFLSMEAALREATARAERAEVALAAKEPPF